MTDQEIYNKVRKHLLTQMKRSKTEDGCCYVSPDGTRCAAGCLLPDGYVPPPDYNTGVSVHGISIDDGAPEVMYDAFRDHRELLTLLQSIHDGRDPVDWKTRLDKVAAQYNLEIVD